jgi:hypothetical protein
MKSKSNDIALGSSSVTSGLGTTSTVGLSQT